MFKEEKNFPTASLLLSCIYYFSWLIKIHLNFKQIFSLSLCLITPKVVELHKFCPGLTLEWSLITSLRQCFGQVKQNTVIPCVWTILKTLPVRPPYTQYWFWWFMLGILSVCHIFTVRLRPWTWVRRPQVSSLQGRMGTLVLLLIKCGQPSFESSVLKKLSCLSDAFHTESIQWACRKVGGKQTYRIRYKYNY